MASIIRGITPAAVIRRRERRKDPGFIDGIALLLGEGSDGVVWGSAVGFVYGTIDGVEEGG